MTITNRLRICILGVVTFAASGLAMAQDQMAYKADMDRQLKQVQAVKLQYTYKAEQAAAADWEHNKMVHPIYTTWNTTKCNPYGNTPKPRYMKIDLRDFSIPLKKAAVVTSNFGYRRRFGRKHYGTDIDLFTGDTVVAAFSGKVRVVKYDAGGFGYYVVLRHPNGLETVYGHLSKQLVVQDQIVKSGEPIALGGNTGHSFGSHLHFETRILGEPIDPTLMFDFAHRDVKSDYYVYRNAAGVDYDNIELPEGEMLAAIEPEPAPVEERETASTAATTPSRGKTSASKNSKRASIYKVKRGDTLYAIAKRSGMTVDQLCRRNNLKASATLRLGQILKLN